VNGRPVAARARLRNGDEIQIGSTRLRFQEKERT
jgi:pSer/pThr/pTyr-binding forkhead associated (FHA) protein